MRKCHYVAVAVTIFGVKEIVVVLEHVAVGVAVVSVAVAVVVVVVFAAKYFIYLPTHSSLCEEIGS